MRRTLIAVSGLIGLVLAVAAIASASTGAAVAGSRSPVVSPRPGATVSSYPVIIRVRASSRTGALRGWLNGRPIGSQFGRARGGVRSVGVSISQGLRPGVNVLRVWVSKSDGGWNKVAVRFTVAGDRPLAGAGSDVVAVVGQAVKLNGTLVAASPPEPTPPAFTGSAASLHWALIDRPPNSPRVALSNPQAASPTFTPDVPGSYTFRLTAGEVGRASSDTVTVDALPPSPLVPIHTQAQQGGTPGIDVGGTFYPEDANAGGFSGFPYWQVLVLDRRTLGLVSNTTYFCQPPTGCGYSPRERNPDALATDVAKLDDTKLVIAALHPVQRLVSISSVSEFKSIGAPGLNGASVHFGFASLIGVPGLPEGRAFSRLVPDSREHTVGADMAGYLTRDQLFDYTFLPQARVPFDTRATPSAGWDNNMQVGGTAYQAKLSGAPGGYHVVVLDGFTLALRDGGFFRTGQTDAGGATSDVKQMTEFLNQKVGRDDVVLIDSVDRPGEAPLNGGADKTALRDLASAVARVGGTRDLFNRSGIKANSLYSLIGSGDAGEANGQETSIVKDPVPGDGRLRGVFTADNASLFKPTTSSAFGDPPEALADLVVQPPGKWPLDGNDQAQKAIAYIGSQPDLKNVGSDPRAAYWLRDDNQATWDANALAVERVPYPGDGHGFERPAFEMAQTELAKEMRWVGKVRTYMTHLTEPFDANSQMKSWANMTEIAQDVIEKVKPPENKATAAALKIIGGVATIGGLAASKALEGIAVVYEVGLHFLVKEPDGDSEASITVSAAKLGGEMVTRFDDARKSFFELGSILVGDYSKLQTVASLGECQPGPGCPPEWQLQPEDKSAASAAAYKSAEAEFDQALMKVAFPAYVLGPRVVHYSPHHDHVTTNARDYDCGGGTSGAIPFYPFDDLQDNGQVALLQELPNLYDVLAMGNTNGLDLIHPKPALPPQSVLDRMFAPLSTSLNVKVGGLGIYKPDFMRAANQGKGNYPFRPYACGMGFWSG